MLVGEQIGSVAGSRAQQVAERRNSKGWWGIVIQEELGTSGVGNKKPGLGQTLKEDLKTSRRIGGL